VSTFVDFTPSTTEVFAFQPTLSNGVQYAATVTWNVFGQRWYLTLADLQGNQIVTRALCASGPQLPGSFTWDDGVASVTTTGNHNVPIASQAAIRVLQTDSGFDGQYLALATDAAAFTYPLPTDPGQSAPISGTVSFDLDLLAGYGIGSLFFHYETQQFEF
jgi:hypothetical protein